MRGHGSGYIRYFMLLYISLAFTVDAFAFFCMHSIVSLMSILYPCDLTSGQFVELNFNNSTNSAYLYSPEKIDPSKPISIFIFQNDLANL